MPAQLTAEVTQPAPDGVLALASRPQHLVVGVANPGRREQHDRANVGVLASRAAPGAGTGERFGAYLVRHVQLDGVTVLAATPEAQVEPGPHVAELLRWCKVAAAELILLYEDLDHLELGLLRVRTRGKDGHAGASSIAKALGTNAIARVRIGVGRPGGSSTTTPAALSAEELALLPPIFTGVWGAVRLLALGQGARAMSIYNRRDRTVDGRKAAPHLLPDGRIRGQGVPRRKLW